MRLTSLAAEGFRNLATFSLNTDARFVVLHGANAQGKTNALEAAYYLATLKPLRGTRPRDLIAWKMSKAVVTGTVCSGGVSRRHRVELEGGQRVPSVDGKETHTLVDYFGGIRAIAFRPADGGIVTGEPRGRRSWLDRAAFTASPAHLERVRLFRRGLAQKAAELRADHPDEDVLDVLDHQLATSGAALVAYRERLLDELRSHVQRIYDTIAATGRQVDLQYRTVAVGETQAERTAALQQALVEARPAELRRRMALVGPQRDDVLMSVDQRRARDTASRGQVRSLVLALKLAELAAARDRDQVPMFLLDDLSSELDRDRTRRLVSELQQLEAQVMITTTDPTHLQGLPEEDTLRWSVDGGTFS